MKQFITIIAGGRNTNLTNLDKQRLNKIAPAISEVLTGAASGIDTDAEEWAKEKGIPVRTFPADWKLFGRKAGAIRNKQMALQADLVILFPGGRGTQLMYEIARECLIHIIDWRKTNAA